MKFLNILIIVSFLFGFYPLGATAEDSSSFTPPDVTISSSAGNGFSLTKAHEDTLTYERSSPYFSSAYDSVVLGDYKICLISKFQSSYDYNTVNDLGHDKKCEVYKSDGDFYLALYHRHYDNFYYVKIVCKAVCYN